MTELPERATRLERFIEHPRRAMWTVSAPMIGGMVLHVLYNVVDTAFVGRLGPAALAGLTLVFPLFFVLIALANGFGSGITVLVAQAIGRRDHAAAERAGGTALAFGLGLGLLFALAGSLGGPQLIALLGGRGEMGAAAWAYFSVLALAAPLPLCNALLRSLLTGQGDARTPMMVMAVATLLNVALDPLLIFVAGLGIRGAALATALSQLVGLTLLLVLVSRARIGIPLRRSNLLPRWTTLRQVTALGLPASLSQLLMAMAALLINRLVASFGEDALAGYGAASRIDAVVALPIIGLAGGAVAVIGMFAGASRADLVRSTTHYVFRWALTVALLLGLPAFAASGHVLRVFTDHAPAIAIGREYLGFMVFVYPMMGVGMVSARLLLGLGYPSLSLAVTAIRLVLITVPAAYIAVYLFDARLIAAWWSVLIGSAVATLTALALVYRIVWRGDPTLRAREAVRPRRAGAS